MAKENEKPNREVKLTGDQVVRLYQAEREKLNVIVQRVQALQQAVIEIRGTIDAAKELKKGNQGEIMVPLGAGVFAEAEVKNSGKVKVMLAGKVLVEQETEKAVAMLEERLKKANEEVQKALAERDNVVKSVNNLASIIQEAENQRRKRG